MPICVTPAKLLKHLSDLDVWVQDAQRVPYKALLLLIALARIQAEKTRLMYFDEVETKFQQLIKDFSPNRAHHSESAFWDLRLEKFWEIPQSHVIPISIPINNKYLLEHQIQGGFTKEVFSLLNDDPELLEQAALTLLNAHYPSSIHQDVLDSVGLDIDSTQQSHRTKLFSW